MINSCSSEICSAKTPSNEWRQRGIQKKGVENKTGLNWLETLMRAGQTRGGCLAALHLMRGAND